MNAINSTYNNIKSILPQAVEWINVLCAIYLSITLILPFEYQRLALYLYFTTTGLDIIINKRYTNLKWDKTKWLFVAMILFYLCIWIWHPFEETKLDYFQSTAEKRIGLLAFGILGLCSQVNPKLKAHYLAIPIMSTGITILLYVLYKINFWETEFNSFQTYQHIVAIHRGITMHISHIQFNLYMNCGMILGFYGITRSKKLWQKIAYISFMIPSVATIITSEGRIGVISTLAIICIIAYYYTHKISKYILIPFAIISFVVAYTTFCNNYRIADWQSRQNPRIEIWHEAIKMIKEKPMGYGISDGRAMLVPRLFENNKLKEEFLTPWFIDFPNYPPYSLHAHNIFLETMIEFGAIGLILLCSILLHPILTTKGTRRLIVTLIIMIFTLQGMTESFGSSLSIFLLSWLLYILTSNSREEEPSKKVNELSQI